jgi:hypothetical protein
MSKKNKGLKAPIPSSNQPRYGPRQTQDVSAPRTPHGAPASEQDPKRRLGDYGTAGEHPIEQPGGKQGPNR